MTPEREADIRRIIPYWTPTTAGTAIEDLLAEIDRLCELRINSQATYDLVLEKYDSLKAAAEPFITHSAKLVSKSTDGKAYMLIEVPWYDILNLRRELKGS
jgi:hypothetical protein